MWAAGGECKERQPTPGHYHRNGCTAQKTAQKKPRQEAGLVCGSAMGACRRSQRAEGISGRPANSTRQTHHRLHSAPAPNKSPATGSGAKFFQTGLPKCELTANPSRQYHTVGCTARGRLAPAETNRDRHRAVIPLAKGFRFGPRTKKPRQSGAKSNHEGSRKCE
jgi:hypothetical protein